MRAALVAAALAGACAHGPRPPVETAALPACELARHEAVRRSLATAGENRARWTSYRAQRDMIAFTAPLFRGSPEANLVAQAHFNDRYGRLRLQEIELVRSRWSASGSSPAAEACLRERRGG